MFHGNTLLKQLKQQLHSQKIQKISVEGVVKVTGKGFGFLEVNTQKSYFIPPTQMKKVMHGDRISATINTKEERESAEPKVLIKPFLTRFVGKVYKKDDRMSIIPDHPLLQNEIPCHAAHGIEHNFKEGDWAVAEMRHHPLKSNYGFYAELTQFIAYNDDHFMPWWVTLARYNLEKEDPEGNIIATEMLDEGLKRRDLTGLDFITIDNVNTEDMDDALYVEESSDNKLRLTVAIADPTAWIAEGSTLDEYAKMRSFTNYLPNLNVSMLPRELSNDLCSLRPNKVRPAIVCCMTIASDGAIEENVEFFAATIKSKAKLTYDNVSGWLENINSWQPENESIAAQIRLLQRLCLSRRMWRTTHALVLKNRPDYRFVLNKKGELLDIVVEPRRIANRIVEESMIAANICAAHVLRDKLGFGIYNIHTGLDPANTETLVELLKIHDIDINPEEIFTLNGFCKLRRKLDAQPSGFLNNRINRFQSLAEISTKPGPHFGLGLKAYATWTSPIRKYGDIINHRLLKAIMKGETVACPQEKTIVQITERRRLNRMAERDLSYWLYALFLNKKVGTDDRFAAEIIDINRSGIRVLLIDNGAVAYIPLQFLHPGGDELVCNQKNGYVQVRGETVYKVTDVINITIAEVRMETRSIIARPVI